MLSKVLEKLETLPEVDSIYISKKEIPILFLNKMMFNTEFITLKIEQMDKTHWRISDDGFISNELSLFYGRNVLQDVIVNDKINQMTKDICVDRPDPHVLLLYSRNFTIDNCTEICSRFFKTIIEFVIYIEGVENAIPR